jgi:hypothetical protein
LLLHDDGCCCCGDFFEDTFLANYCS